MVWILLVDDESEIRETTAEILRDEGYVVVEAEDAQKALQKLITARRPPSLVLLDLMMPKMRGEALLEMLREIGMLHELDIVAFTASMTQKVSGTRSVLHKPFSLLELLDLAALYCPSDTRPSSPTAAT